MDPRLRIIEDIYRFELTRHDHSLAITSALSGQFGPQNAMAFWATIHSPHGHSTPEDVLLHHDAEGVLGSGLAVRLPQEDVNTFIRSPAAVLAISQLSSTFVEMTRRGGIPEFVGLFCPLDRGRGLIVGTKLESPWKSSAQLRSYWAPVAQHLAAAWRLRNRLEGKGALKPAAFVSPNGEVLDAAGVAQQKSVREILREGVRSREGARSSRRSRDDLWPELIDGRFTIIDRFESDGRRVIVAYRNDDIARRPLALSQREAQALSFLRRGAANKVIALELGISEATASRVVQSALRKLGMNAAEFVSVLHVRPNQVWTTGSSSGLVHVFELPPEETESLVALSPAEREVIQAVLRGHSSARIAHDRQRSARTVALQTGSAFRKLGVQSRRELLMRFASGVPSPS